MWKGLLEQKRAAYQQFRQELIIDPKKQETSAAADHPLSQSSSSKWNAFFKVNLRGSAIGKSVIIGHRSLVPALMHPMSIKKAVISRGIPSALMLE